MWNKLLHILSSDSQSQTGSDSNILINIRMKTPIWPNDTLKVRKGTGETLAYPPKTEPEQKKGRGTASAIKTVNTLLSFIRQNENVNETLGKPVFSEAGISSLCCKRWGSGSGCCQPEQGCACPIPVPRPSVPSRSCWGCSVPPHPTQALNPTCQGRVCCHRAAEQRLNCQSCLSKGNQRKQCASTKAGRHNNIVLCSYR